MYVFWILLLTFHVSSGQILDIVCGSAMPEPAPMSRVNPNILVYSRNKNLQSFRLKRLDEVDGRVADLEKRGYFKTGQQVVFIVHGFWNNELFSWQYNLKDAVLKAEESTVFIVTWGSGSLTPSYPQAGANTRTVATAVAALADSVAKTKTFGSRNSLYVYCIGHSLGAQICGQAGRISGKFNRITGMDPAGPGFETCWAQYRVNTSSATCVDHIHTDGSGKGHINPVVPYYGTLNQWGHVDFYPNGGEDQTGCSILTNDISCSHMKSIDYFIYSVGNPKSCIAKHTCTTTRTPESCRAGSGGQQMGYFSSCHRANQAVQSGLVSENKG